MSAVLEALEALNTALHLGVETIVEVKQFAGGELKVRWSVAEDDSISLDCGPEGAHALADALEAQGRYLVLAGNLRQAARLCERQGTSLH